MKIMGLQSLFHLIKFAGLEEQLITTVIIHHQIDLAVIGAAEHHIGGIAVLLKQYTVNRVGRIMNGQHLLFSRDAVLPDIR